MQVFFWSKKIGTFFPVGGGRGLVVILVVSVSVQILYVGMQENFGQNRSQQARKSKGLVGMAK